MAGDYAFETPPPSGVEGSKSGERPLRVSQLMQNHLWVSVPESWRQNAAGYKERILFAQDGSVRLEVAQPLEDLVAEARVAAEREASPSADTEFAAGAAPTTDDAILENSRELAFMAIDAWAAQVLGASGSHLADIRTRLAGV